jgi:hypothetical protein
LPETRAIDSRWTGRFHAKQSDFLMAVCVLCHFADKIKQAAYHGVLARH